MNGSSILEENPSKTKITKDQLYAKLREVNVLNFDQVRAVVLEDTGVIWVLHSADDSEPFDQELLRGVEHRGSHISGSKAIHV